MKTKIKNMIYGRTLWVVLSMFAVAGTLVAGTPESKIMVGHWEGTTHVIVVWCEKKELNVTLDIFEDGKVTGKVGDAKIVNGKMSKKKNWLGREGAERTTHLLKGELSGPIVADEGIFREKVFIHLRVNSNTLEGSLATSGSRIGGKEKMALTTTNLKVHRTQ